MHSNPFIARRNFWIRTIAGITGDISVGYALASVCTWAIQSASLGIFLSFLAWLVAIALGLVLSQYVVHPAVEFALCDRKLDVGIAALSSLAAKLDPDSTVWGLVRQRVDRFASSFAAK